jgi:hypothetical protein
MSEEIWLDSEMHPDLFDGETPTRKKVSLDDIGLAVFKVDLTYYEPEEETYFVVAPSYEKAEDIAWGKVARLCGSTGMDTAEVTEMKLDDNCVTWRTGLIVNGEHKTARDLLVEHIRENGCTLTQS